MTALGNDHLHHASEQSHSTLTHFSLWALYVVDFPVLQDEHHRMVVEKPMSCEWKTLNYMSRAKNLEFAQTSSEMAEHSQASLAQRCASLLWGCSLCRMRGPCWQSAAESCLRDIHKAQTSKVKRCKRG